MLVAHYRRLERDISVNASGVIEENRLGRYGRVVCDVDRLIMDTIDLL